MQFPNDRKRRQDDGNDVPPQSEDELAGLSDMILTDGHEDDDGIEQRSVHEDVLADEYELPPPLTESEADSDDEIPMLAASEYGEIDGLGGEATPSLSGLPPASMYFFIFGFFFIYL